MKLKIKIILIAVEALYLAFLTGLHFFHSYGIPSYHTGLIGFFHHSIRLLILLFIFYKFPDPSRDDKSENKVKKERSIFVCLLIIIFLLILILSFFNGVQ